MDMSCLFQVCPKSILKLAVLILVSLLAMPLVVVANDDHMYCLFKESSIVAAEQRRVFYTAVFLGDYSARVGYENAFGSFLKDQYGDGLIFHEYCFFEDTPQAASRDFERDIEEDRRSSLYGGGVIKTGWAPDDFSNQDIQDFRMKISGDSADLQICVRDHECEDGDRIRVAVEGRRVFSGEIDNDWACDTFHVKAGQCYAVELTAINGTGHKGNCNFADVNTGEIRVSGDNVQTQSWRHRGGAGSKAEIIVEAR